LLTTLRPVKLVVAKCWDPNPKGYFTVSKNEPIRPIDPSAWVAHTQAHTNTNSADHHHHGHQVRNSNYGHHNNNRLTHSISSFGSSSSLASSIMDSTITSTYSDVYYNNYNTNQNQHRGSAGTNGNYQYNNYGQHNNYMHHNHLMSNHYNAHNHHQQHHHHHQNQLGTTQSTLSSEFEPTQGGNEQLNLTTDTDMETVVRSMSAPDSGLDVRDRNWLKITIPNAFIGSDVVDWLFNHVEGFPDRRDARKYACNLLKYGYIRHAVNKMRFTEQCYYIFGDFNQSTLNSQMHGIGGALSCNTLGTVNEESETDFDSISEYDRDNYYMPHMNLLMNPQQQPFLQPPGAAYKQQQQINSNNYQIYQPSSKIMYSNMNGLGIGGPPPPPSYMSSSSSNATSNSTSTTSNNTTSQTIGTLATTTTSSMTGLGLPPPQIQQKNQNGILNSERSNACQFYFPPKSLQLTNYTNNNDSQISSSSMLFQNNKNYTIEESQFTISGNNNNNNDYDQNQNTINNTTSDLSNSTINPPLNSIASQSQLSNTNNTMTTNTNNNSTSKNTLSNNFKQNLQHLYNSTGKFDSNFE
jgi:hypothetical protein